MKKAKLIFWQLMVGLIPLCYILSLWGQLSGPLPTHFNSNMEADGFGTKYDILGILFILQGVALFTSLLILNLNKLDPKQRYAETSPLIIKISWVIVIFLSLIAISIVYETQQYVQTKNASSSPKYLLAMLSLLFVVLGNFMNSVKPNYFIGIRTPWTLEDEENWRKTHHLGSKIWFFGGLAMFLLVLFLPSAYAIDVVTYSIIPLAGVPILYSYNIYRKKNTRQIK